MFNPFSAITKTIGKAFGGIGKGIGKALSGTGGALTKAGNKMSGKSPAPKAPSVIKTPTPPVKAPTPPAPAKRPPLLPPSTTGGATGIVGGHNRDERILGEDSSPERDLIEAVKEFEADFGTGGLNRDALAFINNPSFSAILDKYVGPSGFSSDQWLAGMKNPNNINIHKIGDSIDISFDADFRIDDSDDYDLGGRSPSAVF